MAKNEPLRRYFIEIQSIERHSFPSLKDLVDTLYIQGIYKSERTVERDIQDIRKNFGVEIIYDPQNRGYFIDKAVSLNFEAFIRFLEMANTSQLLIEGLQDSKDFLSNIEFDAREGRIGLENLLPLLNAVKSSIKVRFNHVSFYSESIKKYEIEPYFLKEYIGRWYVIGRSLSHKEFRTFGLDRISDIEILQEKFEKRGEQEIRKQFDGIIGLVYSYHKRQFVELSFTPFQGKYIKTLPLHHSQKVLIDNEKEFRISLFVIPNIELEQQILKHGPNVEVLKPEWLRKEIGEKLKITAEKYR